MPASAQTIIDDWATVVAPAPPELKPVRIDPGRTALLVLDFSGTEDPAKGPCNVAAKPRCIASIPKVAGLLAEARAKGVLVIYSLTTIGAVADIAPAIAPHPGDPVVTSGPDKFVGTGLGAILAARGVGTVIVTGTAAEGAVLDTATDAALRGMSVVVPVDGMSSATLYAEQYVAWHLVHAPGLAGVVTLTRIGLIQI